jgi:hypothetical protein
MIKIVTSHIAKLQEQREFWENWYHVKVDDKATGLTRLSFQMTIDNIGYQILWHQELLEHLDIYMNESKEMEQFIQHINFDQMTEEPAMTEEELKLQYTMKLKNEIMKDPKNAVVNLDKIIEELQRQMKKQ